MHRYEVGQPYHPSRRAWPEGAQYNYRQGQHELVLFFQSPTTREIEAVRHGQAARYDQALRYPTTEALLAAANARTRGGA